LTAKSDLLLIFKMLVMKHQHTEAVHAGMDCTDLLLCQPSREINT
jgi:hypothetical protein